jgi:hypothetical protein
VIGSFQIFVIFLCYYILFSANLNYVSCYQIDKYQQINIIGIIIKSWKYYNDANVIIFDNYGVIRNNFHQLKWKLLRILIKGYNYV